MGLLKYTDSIIENDNKFKLRIFIITILTLIIFLSETFFRQPLFDISENLEKNLQANLDLKFFKLISKLGTLPAFLPLTILSFLIFPINIPFTLFYVIIHATYWDNLFKMLYGEARPYWVFRELEPSCNGGFGNPSGHSFSSSAFYLSFWHIITDNDFFEERFYLRVIVLVAFILLIFLIIFSRLVLAAHSINQILFGSLLGTCLYLFIIYVFQMHRTKARNFFELFRSKKKIKIFAIFYFFLFILSLIVYFFVTNKEVIDENADYINKSCKRKSAYRKFNEDGIFHCLSIFGILGAHAGLIFFTNFLEKKNLFVCYEEIYNFNKTKIKYRIFILFILLISGSPIMLFFIIPGDISLFLVFLFKVIVPYSLGLFGLFGVGFYICIQFKICNKEIYEKGKNEFLNPRLSI